MGSIIEVNDTLQLTRSQGFPKELHLEEHMDTVLRVEDVQDKIFSFVDKPGIRVYQAPPVRNFLVENVDGRWIYWGLIHMVEVHHNFEQNTTSGTFRIVYLYTPEEMKQAHALIDRHPDTDYFF